MTKIVLFGCGNIGRRHLQGAATLTPEVVIYDKNPSADETLKHFLQTNKIELNYTFAKNTDEALSKITTETIAIDATTADVRKELMLKILAKKPKAIIAEKPFCQKREEYEEILQQKKNIPIYINLTRRAIPAYQNLAKKLSSEKRMTFLGRFGNLGFACNGTHFLDLAMWLFHEEEFKITHSAVTHVYESKREGYKEFSGNIIITCKEKTIFITMSNTDEMNSIDIMIPYEGWKFLESDGKCIHYTKEIVTETPFQFAHVSQVTGPTIKDIISGKKPALPTIEEAKVAHYILFEMMKMNNISELQFT